MRNSRIIRHECGKLIIEGQTCTCQTWEKDKQAGIGAIQKRNKDKKD